MPNNQQDYFRSVLPQILSGKVEQTAATDGIYALAPRVQSYLKRNDPSGATGPHFSGLPVGGTIRIVKEIWSPLTGNWTATNIDVNFAADITAGKALMTAIIARINAADADLLATDEGGFLTITLAVQGYKHTLTVKKGLANDVSTLLGFYPYPDPRSTARAGDLLSSPPGTTGSIPGTRFPLYDETLTSKGLGRALSSVQRQFSTVQRLLSQPMAVWGTISLQVVDLGGGGTETLAKTPTGQMFYVGSNVTGTLLDSSGNPVYDNSDNPITISGVAYGKTGINLAANFVAWGTPDGKRVDAGTNTTKLKVQPTNISDVSGNIVKATGANFITNGVLVGDVVKIADSTNHLPFNHNGEFAILSVLDEDTAVLRPVIYGESRIDAALDTPASLNSLPLAGGKVHGTISVYLGNWAHSWLKDANQGSPTATDSQCWFVLSAAVALGNYTLLTKVPATLDAPSTSLMTPYVSDGNYAKKNLANTFLKTNTFNTTVKLGEGLKTGAGNAIIPRLQQEINSTASSKTLVQHIKQPAGQTIGDTRIYQVLGGGQVLTQNAVWNGSEWLKDIANQPAYYFKSGVDDTKIARIDSTLFNVLTVGNGWSDSTWLSYLMFQVTGTQVVLPSQAQFGNNVAGSTFEAVFGGGGPDPRPLFHLNTNAGGTATYCYTNKGNFEIIVGAKRTGAGLVDYIKDNATSPAWRFTFNAPDAGGATGGFTIYRLPRLSTAITTVVEAEWEKVFEANLGGVPGIRTSKMQGFSSKGGPYISAKSEAPLSEDLATARGFLATKVYLGDAASAGTIVATGSLALEEEIWIKIVSGGTPGVNGSYALSTDGGVTWGGTVSPIPASLNVSTGTYLGVDLSFSAAFATNAVYAIRSARAPLAKWTNSAGKGRFSISHNGFPAGRFSEIREEWKYGPGSWLGGTSLNYPSADGWKVSVDGVSAGSGGVSSILPPGGSFNTRSLQMIANNDQGGTTNRTNYLQDNLDLVMLTSSTVLEIEWEARVVHGGTADNSNIELFMGLSDSSLPTGVAGLAKRAVFQMLYSEPGTSSWEAAVGDGVTANRAVLDGTGGPVFQLVGPTDGTWNFRIEYHGSATPLGSAIGNAVFVFFIDDQQVAVLNSTVNLAEGTQLLRRLFLVRSVSDKSVSRLIVGPVVMRWNRVTNCSGL